MVSLEPAFGDSAPDVLERDRSGEVQLIFPTRRTLERLAQHSTFEDIVVPAAPSGPELTHQPNLWVLETHLKPLRMIQVELTDMTAQQSLGTFEVDNDANLSDDEVAAARTKNKGLEVS